jgi:hypothetical protein
MLPFDEGLLLLGQTDLFFRHWRGERPLQDLRCP